MLAGLNPMRYRGFPNGRVAHARTRPGVLRWVRLGLAVTAPIVFCFSTEAGYAWPAFGHPTTYYLTRSQQWVENKHFGGSSSSGRLRVPPTAFSSSGRDVRIWYSRVSGDGDPKPAWVGPISNLALWVSRRRSGDPNGDDGDQLLRCCR
jgi:hypothetical protein